MNETEDISRKVKKKKEIVANTIQKLNYQKKIQKSLMEKNDVVFESSRRTKKEEKATRKKKKIKINKSRRKLIQRKIVENSIMEIIDAEVESSRIKNEE